MLVIGSIASDFATLVGLVAGLIAVGGFVGHAPSVLQGATEERTRRATVIGGLAGSVLGVSVMLLSAIAAKLSS
jgi:hypothetical protein